MVINTNCYIHGFQIYGWKQWMASQLDLFPRYQPHVSNCLSHLPLLGPLKTKTKLWFTLLHPQTPLPICCSVVFLYLVEVNGSSLLSFAQAKTLKSFLPPLFHTHSVVPSVNPIGFIFAVPAESDKGSNLSDPCK